MTGEVRHHAAEALTDVCTGHGEGVVWDRPAGLLRFVDLEAGALMTYDPATSAVARRQLGKVVACVRPRRGGGLVVALERSFVLLGAGARWWPSTARCSTTRASGSTTAAATRRGGSGWAPWPTTRPRARAASTGSTPTAATHLVLKNVTISNGLVVRPRRPQRLLRRHPHQPDRPARDRPRGRHGDRPPPVRRGRRSPRRDRRRRRGRGVGGAVGRLGRQPLRRRRGGSRTSSGCPARR